MKIRNIVATSLIGLGVVGLFGHALAVDASKTHSITSERKQWQQERDQLVAAHYNDVGVLMAKQYQDEMQIDTLKESNTNLAAQRQAACLRLTRAGITIPECR